MNASVYQTFLLILLSVIIIIDRVGINSINCINNKQNVYSNVRRYYKIMIRGGYV